MRLRWAALALVLLLCPATAGAAEPWQDAEALRSGLLDAQLALGGGDADGARAAMEAAPDVDPALGAEAEAAIEEGDATAFAALRGRIWTALLAQAATRTIDAAAQGDVATARAWFNVREYRTPTRFTRAKADSTLALQALANGRLDAATAAATVRDDLLDTYDARLREALADVQQAEERDFADQRAEAAGRAAGYFAIVRDAYAAQRGAPAADALAATLDRLVAGDAAALQEARDALAAFRAVALSPEDLARRAGQSVRFVDLVRVEYGRGVHDGQVTKAFEINEAQSFARATTEAFDDLRPTLEAQDPAATKRIATDLDRVSAILRNAANGREVADPKVLKELTDRIGDDLDALFPPEWTRAGSDSDFDVVSAILDQAVGLASAGQYSQAERARLEAYGLLDTGIELRLKALAPHLAARIEALLWYGDGGDAGLATLIADHASPEEIVEARTVIDKEMADARQRLGAGDGEPAAVATNAALIVFREGLEAVLILAAITASMTGRFARYRRPFLIGAGAALGFTALTYWVAGGVIASLARYGERLEAVISLIAVGVLLLITNWFFHKVYWTDWLSSFHGKKKRLMQRSDWMQTAGLVILGFASVYREGVETVLFLQALAFDSGDGVVLAGVAMGLAGAAVIGVLTFALQRRLPYRKMLIATGVTIGVVLVTMTGTTVHLLQAVGWMRITPIEGLELPFWAGQWFGFYATWETVIAQFAAAVFTIGSYWLAEHGRARRRAGLRDGPASEPPAAAARQPIRSGS